MQGNNIAELEQRAEAYRRKAKICMDKMDYYNLVDNLTKVAECYKELSGLATDNGKKSVYLKDYKYYKQTAEQWKVNHPERFLNTAGEPGDGKQSKIESVKDTGVKFENIVGCEDVIKFVEFQYKKRFDKKYEIVFADGRGGNMPRGVLFYGLPGTGKTMLARAIAGEVNAEFIFIKASDIKSRYHGDSEKEIQRIYDEAAEKEGRTIIFIDEIETMIPNRSDPDIKSFEASTVTQFLSVLDGFEKEKMSNVITIAATNYPGRVDPAALRPGRLGTWFRVDLPGIELRTKFIKKEFAKGYDLESDALDYLIKATKGYSGADIVALCDKIKHKLAEQGIAAVDSGYSNDMVIAICSKIVKDEAEEVMKTSNSSISYTSIEALEKFEIDYDIKNSAGTITEYMKNLK